MRAMNKSCIRSTAALAATVILCAMPSAQAQVRITEVTMTATNNVELTNFGAASVDLSPWFFCHRRTYGSRPSGTIAAGQSRLFTVTSLNLTSSDLGLYNSGSFSSTTAMEDFVQWGGSFVATGREGTASAKGIWTTGFFLTVPSAGKSLHAKAQPPATGLRTTNWFPGWPHAGFPVPDMAFETVAIVGGQWRLIGRSYYLTNAHGVDVRDDLTTPWVPVTAPTIVELGGGRLDIRFPATGVRQFTRLRAQ